MPNCSTLTHYDLTFSLETKRGEGSTLRVCNLIFVSPPLILRGGGGQRDGRVYIPSLLLLSWERRPSIFRILYSIHSKHSKHDNEQESYVKWNHRRRIKTEEKAKVVASVWGANPSQVTKVFFYLVSHAIVISHHTSSVLKCITKKCSPHLKFSNVKTYFNTDRHIHRPPLMMVIGRPLFLVDNIYPSGQSIFTSPDGQPPPLRLADNIYPSMTVNLHPS